MSKFQVNAITIGNWSKDNFGNSPVEYLVITDAGVELNFLAPLLGIGEEIGELNQAIDATLGPKYVENIIDAIGDIGIYLADYCKRRNIFPLISNTHEAIYRPSTNLSSAYGNLCHAELKHAQKIRNMGDIAEFSDKARGAVTELYYTLNNVSLRFTGNPVEAIIETTFRNQVAKRNWKKNATDGTSNDSQG